jgi:hypothetical protein
MLYGHEGRGLVPAACVFADDLGRKPARVGRVLAGLALERHLGRPRTQYSTRGVHKWTESFESTYFSLSS